MITELTELTKLGQITIAMSDQIYIKAEKVPKMKIRENTQNEKYPK